MSTLKHAATLSIGNAAAQGITLVGYALLARLYSPEQFGFLAVVMGVATIAAVAASCRYDMTILLPKSDRVADLALTTSLGLSVFVCVLFALAMLAMSFTTTLAWPRYWLAIAAMTFAMSGIQTYGFKRNREKRYKHTIYVQIIRAICVIGISAALVFRADGLLWGHVLGYLAAFLACMAIEYRVAGRFFLRFSFRKMVFWLRRNDEFFKLSMPAVFISTFAGQIPVFLLAHFFGAMASGYYSFISKTVMAPVALISGSLNVIYMQKITKLNADRKPLFPTLRSLNRNLSLASLLVSGAFVVFCLLNGYRLVFGETWKALDALAIILTPMMAVSFVSRSLPGFAVLRQNGKGLVYQIVLALSSVLSIAISAWLWNDLRSTMLAYSLVATLVLLGQVVSLNTIALRIDRKVEAERA